MRTLCLIRRSGRAAACASLNPRAALADLRKEGFRRCAAEQRAGDNPGTRLHVAHLVHADATARTGSCGRQCNPNCKTVHRCFQQWCEREIPRASLVDLASELRDRGEIDESERSVGATSASAKGGGADVGPTRQGKGVKVMAIVDRHGLPLSASPHAANHHEVTLAQPGFDFCMIEAKPQNLVGGKAYDSDVLDQSLKKHGTEMIAPLRSIRTLKTQDGRRLRRYARRRLVERCFRMAKVEAAPGCSVGVLRR